MTITYSWIPDKISIQEYKSARLDSPSSCSIVHYNVLVDWHLCHLRRAAVWARWKMLNNILVSRNTRPMPRSVMSIKLQKHVNLLHCCLKLKASVWIGQRCHDCVQIWSKGVTQRQGDASCQLVGVPNPLASCSRYFHKQVRQGTCLAASKILGSDKNI